MKGLALKESTGNGDFGLTDVVIHDGATYYAGWKSILKNIKKTYVYFIPPVVIGAGLNKVFNLGYTLATRKKASIPKTTFAK